MYSPRLKNRFPDHFLDCSDPVLNFSEPGPAQADHAAFRRSFLDIDGRTARKDQVADDVVDHHNLDETDAPLVSGVIALVASPPFEDLKRADFLFLESEVNERLRSDVDHFLAVLTDAAREPLCSNELHRSGHEERLDAHVHPAIDRR